MILSQSTIAHPTRVKVSIATLYFFQGLQQGFFFFVLPAHLLKTHALFDLSLLLIAINLPWSLKLFLSPLVDRFASRKTWITANYLAIVSIFLSQAVINSSLAITLVLTALTNLLFACQDIAQDTYAVEQYVSDTRSLSGVMESGKPLGAIVGAMSGGLALELSGIHACYFVMACFYLAALCFCRLALVDNSNTGKRISHLLKATLINVRRNENLKLYGLCCLLVMPMGFIQVVFTHHFLTTLGWDKWTFIEKIGLWAPLGGFVGGVLAAIFSRYWSRVSVLKTACVAILTLLVILFQFQKQTSPTILSILVASYQLCNALILAAILSYIFAQSSREARATTITLAVSWVNLCISAGYLVAGLLLTIGFALNLSIAFCLIATGILLSSILIDQSHTSVVASTN